MGIPVIVGLCLAGICLVLLIVALVQLNTLRGSIADVDQRIRSLHRAADESGRIDRVGPTLVNLLEQVRRVDEKIERLSSSGSPGLLRRASSRAPAADLSRDAPAERTGVTDAAVDRDAGPPRAPPPPEPAPARETLARAWPSSLPDRSVPSEPIAAPDGTMLEEYRALIAQPRKSEINRWTDERGAKGCEVAEDGTFRSVDRDAGALLVLVPFGDTRALVLPSGRLVVDFATDFAAALSLRSVTRQSYELVEDGSGVLRLLEPALANLRDGVWHLASAGKISGLNG